VKRFMKNVNWSKPGYASITCSTISNFPYNLIFTTKFNDSSNLITIISCNYLNLLLADEHVGDVTIPTQVIEYNQNIFSRLISQSDWNIQIKLNHICIKLYVASMWTISLRRKCQETITSMRGLWQKTIVYSLHKDQTFWK
jgi:hypothetical protein